MERKGYFCKWIRLVYKRTWYGFLALSVFLAVLFGLFIWASPHLGVDMSTQYFPILAIAFIFLFLLVSMFGFIWWMDQEERKRIIELISKEENEKIENQGVDIKQLKQKLEETRDISSIALFISLIVVILGIAKNKND